MHGYGDINEISLNENWPVVRKCGRMSIILFKQLDDSYLREFKRWIFNLSFMLYIYSVYAIGAISILQYILSNSFILSHHHVPSINFLLPIS